MAKTVDEGFRDFLGTLTPKAAETQAAKDHRASIKTCLESNFAMTNFFRTGSFGNGTSVSGFSDVDYFAVIPPGNLYNSSGYSLAKVRDALDTRFPRTGVRVDCPAVKIPFGTNGSESTEVVPSYYIEKKSGQDVYAIPDCEAGWMRSSPDAHNRYVREVDGKLGNKVKPLIRFIKAWKYLRQVPISSFYLELRVAKYASEESSIVYDQDIKCIFKMLDDNGLARMQDPMGISGYISACSSEAKLEDAKSKVSTALSRADKAVSARMGGKIEDAFNWWDLIFNGKFPRYSA